MKKILAVYLLRMLASTWRITLMNPPLPQPPIILAFWHGVMLPVWKYFAERGATGVTSLSKDGDLLAALLMAWGYDVVRGSSSRGGSEVLQQMVIAAQTGNYVLITPDGPRGPAGVFKPGGAVAAMRSGVPLVQCRVECRRAIRLSHWDSFMIPLPFAQVNLHFSEPIIIATETERDEVTALLERLSEREPA